MPTPLPSPRHNAALHVPTGYRRRVIVTLNRAGNTVQVDPTAANFSQDIRRAGHWAGSLTIADPALLPTTPADILTPFGTTVNVELGVELADGTVSTVPYGRYVVASSSASISADQRVTQVQLVDLSERIERYRFEEPLTIPASTDLATMINTVVASRVGVSPQVSATGRLLGAPRTFGLDPETGPWTEILDVLRGFGLTAWYNRVGQIVVGTATPSAGSAIPLIGPTDISVAFDVRPPNVIVVRGEPPDAPPVQAVAIDDNPGSPTYAGTAAGLSPYGRVTRYYSSPVIYTVQQATETAENMLAQSIGQGATYQLTRPFDPTIDATDAVARNGLILGIDAVTVDVNGDTSIVARQL